MMYLYVDAFFSASPRILGKAEQIPFFFIAQFVV